MAPATLCSARDWHLRASSTRWHFVRTASNLSNHAARRAALTTPYIFPSLDALQSIPCVSCVSWFPSTRRRILSDGSPFPFKRRKTRRATLAWQTRTRVETLRLFWAGRREQPSCKAQIHPALSFITSIDTHRCAEFRSDGIAWNAQLVRSWNHSISDSPKLAFPAWDSRVFYFANPKFGLDLLGNHEFLATEPFQQRIGFGVAGNGMRVAIESQRPSDPE